MGGGGGGCSGGGVGVWVVREGRGGGQRGVAVLGAVWVREGCGWAVRAVRAVRAVGACWGSNKTRIFMFWRSLLNFWRKGRHVGGGGHGSMWAAGAVGVVGAVWVWVAREGRGVGGRGWVREGCGWAVSTCRCWGGVK